MRFKIAILFSLILIYIVCSCSDAKQAQQGYKKFIRNGGKIDCANDTIWKKDTTYLEGKMIIDSFPIPCDCAEVEIPKTKYEIRYEYKTKHDSINLIKYVTKYKYRTIVKYKKIEEKTKFSWTWFLIALFSWIVLGFIIFKKYIKR